MSGTTTNFGLRKPTTHADTFLPQEDIAHLADDIDTALTAGRGKVQALAATGNISATAGNIVTFSGAAAQTLMLPAASVGMRWEIWNIDTADSVTVARNTTPGTDTINGASAIVIPPTCAAKVTCVAAGVFVAEIAPIYAINQDLAVQATTASATISAYVGTVYHSGAPGATLTLPAAVIGKRFQIWNASSSAVTVSRNPVPGTDTIVPVTTAVGAASFVLAANTMVSVTCVSAGTFLYVV